jgi:DNA-binding IclR family transcriptional regulator
MAQVPAARNVLRMLRMLAGRTAPVAAASLARELGIPRSTLYQLARTMMDEGFLVHYPEERAYGLSALVVEIGSASLAVERLGRMSQPLMARLIQRLPVPTVAHLAVLTGAEVTYVTRMSAPRAPTTVSNVGVRLPAHLTATGRAMLAQLPAAQVRALYPHRESLIRRQGPGPATLDQLSALLAASRERGWAVEDGDVTSGYSSVGAAAFDHKGYPAAAIGLTFRSGIHAGVSTELGHAVEDAAASLSARITGH